MCELLLHFRLSFVAPASEVSEMFFGMKLSGNVWNVGKEVRNIYRHYLYGETLSSLFFIIRKLFLSLIAFNLIYACKSRSESKFFLSKIQKFEHQTFEIIFQTRRKLFYEVINCSFILYSLFNYKPRKQMPT